MFNPDGQRKRIQNNLFKVKPGPSLKRTKLDPNQKTLNFFAPKKPLITKSESDINKAQHVKLERSLSSVEVIEIKSSQPISLLSQRDSFNELDTTDKELFEVKKQPTNLKNSVPIGSIIRSKTSKQDKQILDQLSNSTKLKQSWDNKKKISNIKNPRLQENRTSRLNYDNIETSFALSEEQTKVVNLVVKENKSIFFTGSAGTGKSVILRELVKRLHMKYGKNAIGVTASTGLAACNIGGITINRLSGVGIGERKAADLLAIVKRKMETKEQWKRLKVLIIDEISMLDGNFFDKLEYIARNIRQSDRPFGGIQIVLTGDFFQLPPVPSRNGPPVKFCFESQSWPRVIHKTILLKQVFRQKDREFANILDNLRIANVNKEMEVEFQKLQRTVVYEDGIGPTELFPTRAEVENSNRKTLQSLAGKEFIYTAKDTGPDRLKYLLENTMAQSKLVLKEDANVMMLKNKSDTLVNGSVGKVITFLSNTAFLLIEKEISSMRDIDKIQHLRMFGKLIEASAIPDEFTRFINTSFIDPKKCLEIAELILRSSEEPLPIVKFMNNGNSSFTIIERDEFTVGSNEEEGLVRLQIPLLLSWALSIHKSQGQTLDRVKVDLTKVFEAGQVYTALSRATSRDRLQVINFQNSKIRAHSKVKEFYDKLQSI